MNTKAIAPVRVLNDKYTFIGYGDGEKLRELFSLLNKEQILLSESYTTFSKEWTPLRHTVNLKPLDDTKQWNIHISYGKLSENDIKRLREIGDVDGLIDEVIHKRNFDKIRIETNPNLAEGDKTYNMALDIIADYFKMTHTSRIDIAIDYPVDFLNTCKIVDSSSRPKDTNWYNTGLYGNSQTLYIGNNRMQEQIKCYNKKLERKVKGKPTVGYTPVSEEFFRLEVSFLSKISTANFASGRNPYENYKFVPKDFYIKLSELKKRYKEPLAKGLFLYQSMLGDTEELKLEFPPRTLSKYRKVYKELLEEYENEIIDPFTDYEKHKCQLIEELASYQRKFTGNELNFSNLN